MFTASRRDTGVSRVTLSSLENVPFSRDVCVTRQGLLALFFLSFFLFFFLLIDPFPLVFNLSRVPQRLRNLLKSLTRFHWAILLSVVRGVSKRTKLAARLMAGSIRVITKYPRYVRTVTDVAQTRPCLIRDINQRHGRDRVLGESETKFIRATVVICQRNGQTQGLRPPFVSRRERARALIKRY